LGFLWINTWKTVRKKYYRTILSLFFLYQYNKVYYHNIYHTI